jgi:hypothetical protein
MRLPRDKTTRGFDLEKMCPCVFHYVTETRKQIEARNINQIINPNVKTNNECSAAAARSTITDWGGEEGGQDSKNVSLASEARAERPKTK